MKANAATKPAAITAIFVSPLLLLVCDVVSVEYLFEWRMTGCSGGDFLTNCRKYDSGFLTEDCTDGAGELAVRRESVA